MSAPRTNESCISSYMTSELEVRVNGNKEELYRRLGQSRRLANEANDPLTQSRLQALTLELESQLAAVETRDDDAPASGGTAD
jgi:hypothetical protein